VASTAARNRGYGTSGAAAGHVSPGGVEPSHRGRLNAGAGGGPWADSATVEQIPHLNGARWSFVDSYNLLGYNNFLYGYPW
jgi:hypothetical protein